MTARRRPTVLLLTAGVAACASLGRPALGRPLRLALG